MLLPAVHACCASLLRSRRFQVSQLLPHGPPLPCLISAGKLLQLFAVVVVMQSSSIIPTSASSSSCPVFPSHCKSIKPGDDANVGNVDISYCSSPRLFKHGLPIVFKSKVQSGMSGRLGLPVEDQAELGPRSSKRIARQVARSSGRYCVTARARWTQAEEDLGFHGRLRTPSRQHWGL